jgi:putative acetyltransferase
MNVAIIIRPYEPSDLDAVIAIFQRAVRETAVKDYNEAQIQAWSQVDRSRWEMRRMDRPTWVAVVHERLAGFTDLEPNGHLDMLFVHPANNGKGVASALLQTVEDVARKQNLSRIFTEASITARPFFEKRGFQVITPQVVEIRGQWLKNFRMEKWLLASNSF